MYQLHHVYHRLEGSCNVLLRNSVSGNGVNRFDKVRDCYSTADSGREYVSRNSFKWIMYGNRSNWPSTHPKRPLTTSITKSGLKINCPIYPFLISFATSPGVETVKLFHIHRDVLSCSSDMRAVSFITRNPTAGECLVNIGMDIAATTQHLRISYIPSNLSYSWSHGQNALSDTKYHFSSNLSNTVESENTLWDVYWNLATKHHLPAGTIYQIEFT